MSAGGSERARCAPDQRFALSSIRTICNRQPSQFTPVVAGPAAPIAAVSSGTAPTPPAGPADPASNVSYAAGTITQSATVVATGTPASDLTGVTPVVTGASTGISTASWNPSISVLVPANFAPGVYAATITHSVA